MEGQEVARAVEPAEVVVRVAHADRRALDHAGHLPGLEPYGLVPGRERESALDHEELGRAVADLEVEPRPQHRGLAHPRADAERLAAPAREGGRPSRAGAPGARLSARSPARCGACAARRA